MNKKILLLVFVAISLSLIIAAGCKEKECKYPSDCPAGGNGKTATCTEGECGYRTQPNCNGNGICEESSNEDQCTAPDDCCKCTDTELKPCCDYSKCPNLKDTAPAYTYLSSYCNKQNICIDDINEEKTPITPQTFTHTKSLRGFEIQVKSTFDQPFNVDRSAVHFSMEMTDKLPTTYEPTITKIRILGKEGSQTVVLGEKEVKRVFWALHDVIATDVNIDYTFTKPEMEYPVTLEISYEYYEKDSKGQNKTTRDLYTESIRNKVTFVDPSTQLDCDAVRDCNDNNPATTDLCAKSGTKLCNHQPISGRCGNYVCEANENKCLCAPDCGSCEGEAAPHIVYTCAGYQCVTASKTRQNTTLTDEKDFRDFKLLLETDVTIPFHVRKDAFTITLEMSKKEATLVSPVTITKIELLSGDELLGKADLYQDNTLNTIRQKINVSIPVSFMMQGMEEEKQVTMRLHIDYTTQVPEREPVYNTDVTYDSRYAIKIPFVNPST